MKSKQLLNLPLVISFLYIYIISIRHYLELVHRYILLLCHNYYTFKGHNFRMEIILDLTFCFYSRFVNYKSNFPVVSEELKRSSHIKITVYLFVSFRFHFKR